LFGEGATMFTVTQEFEQRIRHVNQMASGGSYVAVFALRLVPIHSPTVEFSSAVDAPDAAPWIPFIREGVFEFLQQRKKERREIGFLRVVLSEIWINETDCKERRFREAAMLAMSQAFARTEMIVEK
jgi:hypothetical protein